MGCDVSTAQMTRQEAEPAIRLRRAPRCDPPFDDERETDPWSSPDQLAFDLTPLMLSSRHRSTGHGLAASTPASAASRSCPAAPSSADSPSSLTSAYAASAAAASTAAGHPSRVSSDARLAVRRFISSCVEVLNGYRPAAHLRRLAQPREAATVVAQGVAAAHRVAEARRRAGTPTRPRRPAPVAVIKVSLCEPRPGAVEAAAILMIGDRTWAMALRLELHDDAWLATVMRLL